MRYSVNYFWRDALLIRKLECTSWLQWASPYHSQSVCIGHGQTDISSEQKQVGICSNVCQNPYNVQWSPWGDCFLLKWSYPFSLPLPIKSVIHTYSILWVPHQWGATQPPLQMLWAVPHFFYTHTNLIHTPAEAFYYASQWWILQDPGLGNLKCLWVAEREVTSRKTIKKSIGTRRNSICCFLRKPYV